MANKIVLKRRGPIFGRKEKMNDDEVDNLIYNYKNAPANIQSQRLVMLGQNIKQYKHEWPIHLTFALIQLTKNVQELMWLIEQQPKILDYYFPTIKALWLFDKGVFRGVSNAVFCRDRNEDTEAFMFRAFIYSKNHNATYFFMCRGFSVAGTDDRYYHWTTQLEAKARCYRATLAVLGIARFRRRAQRDTLGLVAKALWSTRGDQRWWEDEQIKF